MGSTPNWPFGKIPTPQEWAVSQAIKLDDLPVIYTTPGTGSTLESDIGQGAWVLSPPGLIASLTIIAPPGTIEGQRFRVTTTEDIDSLTVTAPDGQTLLGGNVGVLAANGGVEWRFRLATLTWYRWAN